MSDDTPRIDDATSALLARVLSGQATEDERLRLNEWREADDRNERAYRSVADVWEAAEPRGEIEVPPVDVAWGSMRARLEAEPRSEPSPASRTRPAVGRYLAVGLATAAVLALLLGRGIIGPDPVIPNVVAEAPVGELLRVSLADGSTVRIGSGSSLTYSAAFGQRDRRVVLEGDADFDVESGSVPFVVESGTSRVTVLGTRFSVHTAANTTYVTVSEGRVRFEDARTSDSAIEPSAAELTAGDAVVLRDGIRVLTDEEVEAVSGWLDDSLDFISTPVDEVVARLVRQRGWDVRIADGVDGSRRVTAFLQDLDTAEAVSVLAAALGLQASPTEYGWLLG